MRAALTMFLISCFLIVSGCSTGVQEADLILTASQVITLAEKGFPASGQAVALKDSRVLFVGTAEECQLYQGADTVIQDFPGGTIIPGFHDSHCHLYGLGKALAEIDLMGTTSQADVAQRVARGMMMQPGNDWLQGRGWDQNDWEVKEYPTRQLIDEITKDRPALFRRVDGHAALANTAALKAAGISASTADPEGGSILRDENGEPTGLLIDNAVELVREVIPEVSAEEVERRVRLAVDDCLRHGITAVQEAGVSWERAQLYRRLADNGELDLRLFGMYDDVPATLDRGLPAGPVFTENQMFTLRAVKLYADGALGSRGALLHSDYCDHAGNRGLAVSSAEHMKEVAARAADAGFQVCTHAIGDRANTIVLDIYEDLIKQKNLTDPRWRVEHAQIIRPNDIPRFADLGIIAAMQPVHCTSDMDWAGERLCEDRLAGAYAWKSLLEAGAQVCWGTDFPVEKVSALDGLYSSRTRTHHDGTPEGGWQPQEILDARTALELYTIASAHGAFMESELGRIQEGFLGDVTVLDGDPVNGKPEDLLKMKVLATVVGGDIKYQRKD